MKSVSSTLAHLPSRRVIGFGNPSLLAISCSTYLRAFTHFVKKLTNCTSDELKINAEIKIISSPLSAHVKNLKTKSTLRSVRTTVKVSKIDRSTDKKKIHFLNQIRIDPLKNHPWIWFHEKTRSRGPKS